MQFYALDIDVRFDHQALFSPVAADD